MAHTTARQPATQFGVDGHHSRCADTLAVAAAAGMTLIGSSRGVRFSVYAGAERILAG